MMKNKPLIFTIISALISISFYFSFKGSKNLSSSSIKKKYAKKGSQRKLSQALNNIVYKNHKKYKHAMPIEDIMKEFQLRINNDTLYKQEMEIEQYFAKTEESKDIFNLIYAKFYLKDKRRYWKYNSEVLAKIRNRPEEYREEINRIIEKIPTRSYLKEKRELYELAFTFNEEATAGMKNIILNDIMSLPSSRHLESGHSHTPGDHLMSNKSRFLYQSVRLYQKLFPKKNDISIIKNVIKRSQKDPRVAAMLLDLVDP